MSRFSGASAHCTRSVTKDRGRLDMTEATAHKVAFRLMGKPLSCFWCVYCRKHKTENYNVFLEGCTMGHKPGEYIHECRDFTPIGTDRDARE